MKFQGTPLECGQQVYERLLLPVLKEINGQPKTAIEEFYVGVLSSTFGAMAADLGHERAVECAQAVVTRFKGMSADLAGAMPQ